MSTSNIENVTCFPSRAALTGEAVAVSIRDLAHMVQEPKPHINKAIENLRRALDSGDESGARAIARVSIPLVAPAGTLRFFDDGATCEDVFYSTTYVGLAPLVETHSGLILAEVDAPDGGDLCDAIDAFERDPHALLSFVTPSRRGLTGFLRVKLPDAPTLGEAHNRAFQCLAAYCQQRHGLTLKHNGASLAALCYVSHDTETQYNPTAVPFDVEGHRVKINQQGSL